MLEDVLGWVIVLIGAVFMRITDISVLDPIMSIGVAAFIMFNGLKNLKRVLDLFLEKTPSGIEIERLRQHLCELDGVLDVHHIHIRSLDGYNNYATMHIVTDADSRKIKQQVREELKEHGICHATLELEGSKENCGERHCHLDFEQSCESHHHHHHH